MSGWRACRRDERASIDPRHVAQPLHLAAADAGHRLEAPVVRSHLQLLERLDAELFVDTMGELLADSGNRHDQIFG